MKLVALTVTLLLGSALAAPSLTVTSEKAAELLRYAADNFDDMSNRQKIETINEFIDMVFTEFGFLIVKLGLDPMTLPDFSQKVAGANLDLTNGILTDLSKVYRNGDVLVFYDNRVLTTTLPIKFEHFGLNYDYGLKMWGLGNNGKMNGNVADITLYFTIEINFKELVITLKEFVIPDIEKLEVEFEGGVIGSIANAVSKAVTTLFKTTIKDTLQSVIEGTLKTVIEKINGALAGLKPGAYDVPVVINPKPFEYAVPIIVLPGNGM